jgi:tRNA(Arg) A34 adenosine deaminase TadA
VKDIQQITAIIYDKRGRVLSIGKNSYTKSHPTMARYAISVGEPHKIFLHAEIDAILKCRDLSKAHKISIFREGKRGVPLLAKPCKICMSAITAANIPNIEWST